MPQPCAVMCFSPSHGGMDMDALKIAKFLSEATRVVFISKAGTSLQKRADEAFGADSYSIRFQSKLSLSFAKQLRKIVSRNEIANVIFLGASELGSIYLASLGLKLNLIIQHGTTKRRKKKDMYHRLIYRKVRHHVVISDHIGKNVMEIIPVKEEQITKIYPPINFRNINKGIPQLSEVIHLIHTGRIAAGKGQLDAIQACEILHKQGIQFTLTLVGGLDDKYLVKQLEELLEQLPFGQSVTMTGFSNEVEKKLSQSNVFLFPSHGEGLGNSFTEALGSGLQCVCYNNTVFPELKESLGFHFYLAEDRDIDSLKVELLKAVKDLKNSHAELEKNMRLAHEHFSVKNAREAFLKLLI